MPASVKIEQYCPFCQRWLIPIASPRSNFSLRLVVRGIDSDMQHLSFRISNRHRCLDRFPDPPLAAIPFSNHPPVERIAFDGDAPRLADQVVQLSDRQPLGGLGARVVINELVYDRAVEVVG